MLSDKIHPIEHRRLKKGCHCNDDLFFRIYIDHVSAVADGGVDVLFAVNNLPQITVVHSTEVIAFNGAGACHFRNPVSGHDMFSVIAAAIQA